MSTSATRSGARPTSHRRWRGIVLAAAATALAAAGLAAAPADARPPGGNGNGNGNPPPHAAAHSTTTTTAAPTSTEAAPAPTEAPDSPAAPELRRTALRLVVHTTSDWVQVDLPGVSAGHVVAANPQGRQVQPTSRGVVVDGPAGTYGSVAVDVVTEVPGTLGEAWVSVTQGGAGSTFTTVENRTDEPYAVVASNTSPSLTRTSTAVTVDDLMGPVQLEWVRADDERRVLAFTYPWFGEWATTDPSLSMHPTDPSNFDRRADAVEMASLARAHGIDGFVMSFSGGARHGLALHQSLAAATETGGTATILLETAEAGTAAVAEQWIREALRQADSPAFLRLDGVPVIFAFEAARVTAAQWQGIADRLAAEGTPVRIVGDFWAGEAGPISGMYRYNALLQSADTAMTPTELTAWNRGITRTMRAKATLGVGEPGLVVATVQPGWDDRPLRGDDRLTVDWNGTATYDATWGAALAGEPDWIVITSWNEWYEGTSIAPSVQHGTTALEATTAWAQRFRG